MKAFPTGQMRQMTPEWKRLVQETYPKRFRSAAAFAKALGVDKSLITRMLSTAPGAQQTSKLVDKVCDLLKLDPPLQPTVTPPVVDEIDDLIARLRALPHDQRTKVLDTIYSALNLINR
jgi:hypothetical protein